MGACVAVCMFACVHEYRSWLKRIWVDIWYVYVYFRTQKGLRHMEAHTHQHIHGLTHTYTYKHTLSCIFVCIQVARLQFLFQRQDNVYLTFINRPRVDQKRSPNKVIFACTLVLWKMSFRDSLLNKSSLPMCGLSWTFAGDSFQLREIFVPNTYVYMPMYIQINMLAQALYS